MSGNGSSFFNLLSTSANSAGTVQIPANSSYCVDMDLATIYNNLKQLIGVAFTNLGLARPAAPSLSTAGTAGTTSYSYVVVAKDTAGDISQASPAATIATGNATLNGTNYNVVTITAVTGATSYDIYRTASGGSPATLGKIGNTTTTTFNDTGLAGDGTTAPSTATLAANKFTLTVYNGYGNADPNAVVGAIPYVAQAGTTASSVPTFQTTGRVISLTSPVAGQTVWSELIHQTSKFTDSVPRWVRLVFANNDVNTGTLTILGDA